VSEERGSLEYFFVKEYFFVNVMNNNYSAFVFERGLSSSGGGIGMNEIV